MTTLNYDLSAVLADLFYGDESTLTLPKALDLLLAPDFMQRVNGQRYDRAAYTDHVREMRELVASDGSVNVLQEVRAGTAIAGRYVFSFTVTSGQTVRFESHIFAEIADDGRIRRLVEVGRQVTPEDYQDLLSTGKSDE